MSIRFDNLTFDVRTRELYRDGVEVHLPPKAFQLLDLLLRKAPEAVAQEEIYDALWPDTMVNVANLHNLILQIREALGQESRSRIRTIYGYGFAFAGQFERDGDAAARMSRFLLLISSAPGTAFPQSLREGENVVGRDATADVRVLLPSISRHHATIRVHGEDVVLEDLSSKNGTWVDDRRLEAPASIEPGVTIRFGHVISRFLRADPDESTMTDLSSG